LGAAVDEVVVAIDAGEVVVDIGADDVVDVAVVIVSGGAMVVSTVDDLQPVNIRARTARNTERFLRIPIRLS